MVGLYSPREISKCVLRIPIGESDQPPSIEPHVVDATRKLLCGFGGQPGRSVLIAPLSNSNPMLPATWGIDCVAELRNAGFCVFQNTKNMWNSSEADSTPGAIAVYLPVPEALAFCELAGYYIGVRNGLCDLFLASRAKKKALHVRKRYVTNDRYPLSVWLDYRSGFSMRRCSEDDYWDDIDIRDSVNTELPII